MNDEQRERIRRRADMNLYLSQAADAILDGDDDGASVIVNRLVERHDLDSNAIVSGALSLLALSRRDHRDAVANLEAVAARLEREKAKRSKLYRSWAAGRDGKS